MKITDIQAILISIPLRKPTSMSNKTVTAREYVVTRVRTDEGITGSAYTLGGSVVLTAVNDTLKPLVMGGQTPSTLNGCGTGCSGPPSRSAGREP
jgi:L-alanine-DL-glutamate epimerase-like enolase superfamily enzyme